MQWTDVACWRMFRHLWTKHQFPTVWHTFATLQERGHTHNGNKASTLNQTLKTLAKLGIFYERSGFFPVICIVLCPPGQCPPLPHLVPRTRGAHWASLPVSNEYYETAQTRHVSFQPGTGQLPFIQPFNHPRSWSGQENARMQHECSTQSQAGPSGSRRLSSPPRVRWTSHSLQLNGSNSVIRLGCA